MSLITKIENLVNSAQEYIRLKIKETKLEAADKLSSVFASIAAIVILSFFSVMFILFLSIAAGLLLNKILESAYLGFLIVALFWMLIGLLIYFARNRLIKRPLKDRLVNAMFNSNDDQNNKSRP